MKKLISLLLLLSFNIKAQDVTIGTQTWAAKNLDVSTYRNGDKIPQVQDKKAWSNLKTGAWCYYQNNTANGTTYGKLYNWFAVNDPRGLAPKGYHIPTDEEWTILTDSLGGESEEGTEMKSSTGWQNNGNGTNSSGFNGLPGGVRFIDSDFVYIGAYGCWWSSSESRTDKAGIRDLDDYDGDVGRYDDNDKRQGCSVRCLRDLSFKKGQDVTIGTQTWTSKNLDVSTYRNGDVIKQVQDMNAWSNLTTGAWCYYENKTANGTTYGKLYNWYAVNDPRGLAPKGYHIPSDEEWEILNVYLGGGNGKYSEESEAPTKMKSNYGWQNNGNGTNTSGFAGLPGGCRDYNGDFGYIGANGYWWSSSEYDADFAWFRGLSTNDGNVGSYYNFKLYGFSVRCLRDLSFKKGQDVTIGTQTWTSKNLDVSTYRNGDVIKQVQDMNAWSNLTTGAWCYYENKTANGTTYGKLYNWYAVNDPRGLAPKGYHIPSDEEWEILNVYLGGGSENFGGESEAGTKMKSSTGWNSMGGSKTCNVCKEWTDGYRYGQAACKACANWTEYYRGSGNTCKLCNDSKIVNAAKHNCLSCKNSQTLPVEISGNGSNSSGFNGPPGGIRGEDGDFAFVGDDGYWWSSSLAHESTSADYEWVWYRNLNFSISSAGRIFGYGKRSGFSVRCIKD